MLLKKSKKTLKIIPQNDFNIEQAALIREQLIQALKSGLAQECILIFDESQQIDQAGIKLITGLCHECRARNLKISLNIESLQVLTMVKLVGLHQAIDIRES